MHDGYEAQVFLRDLYTSRLWFIKFDLEDKILFFFLTSLNFTITVFISIFITLGNFSQFFVNELNPKFSFLLIMSKGDFFISRQVIIKFISLIRCPVILRKLLSFYHARNCTIGTILSDNLNLYKFLPLGNSNLSFLKANSTREIFIENSDFTLGIVSIESFRVDIIWIIQLYEEIKIRLPFFVIYNRNFKHVLRIFLVESYSVIAMCEIFRSFGSVFDGPITECYFLVCCLFDNCDFYYSIGFSYRVM